MTDLPDYLVDYFAKREAARADAVTATLQRLTEREFWLVKEAAVMGWVQGVRHHDLDIPKDRQILTTVVDACLAAPDLYPTISSPALTACRCGAVPVHQHGCPQES